MSSTNSSGNSSPVGKVENFMLPLQRGASNTASVESISSGMSHLADLIGKWSSTDGSKLGYNVMPLPELGANSGLNFTFKNFYYYETMNFNPIGQVPNRGGEFQQDCYALLYDQRVFFSENPPDFPDKTTIKGKMVHAENGSWLLLAGGYQHAGPYGSPPSEADKAMGAITNHRAPAQQLPLVKQVSVPHGNSLLLVGTIESISGPPTIPALNALPEGANLRITDILNATEVQGNGNHLIMNPNQILSDFVNDIQKARKIIETTILDVGTGRMSRSQNDPYNPNSNETGGLVNIFFINNYAKVLDFKTTLWLLKLDDETSRLIYSQTTTLEFPDPKLKLQGIQFKHVDVNVLARP